MSIKQYKRKLAYFLTSLLFTVLLEIAMPSTQQSISSALQSDRFARQIGFKESPSTQWATPTIISQFSEVAASHLEPNFYKSYE